MSEAAENWEALYKKRTQEYSQALGYLKKAVAVQKKNFVGMVNLLSDILTMVNRELGSHVKSVAEYSKTLAHFLKIDKDQRELLFYSALLHDIGLINAGDEIYRYKPDDDGGEIPEGYRHHPEAGEALIRAIPNLSRVAMVIRHHHEYWDGSGFPDGLEGEDIPLSARIVAVTDAFDWQTRFQQLSPRESLDLIQKEQEKKYDPQIVDAFVGFMDQRLKEKESGIEKVAIKDLHPGHILNDDLLLANGILLFPAGTYLDRQAIDKIRKFGSTLAVSSYLRVHR